MTTKVDPYFFEAAAIGGVIHAAFGATWAGNVETRAGHLRDFPVKSRCNHLQQNSSWNSRLVGLNRYSPPWHTILICFPSVSSVSICPYLHYFVHVRPTNQLRVEKHTLQKLCSVSREAYPPIYTRRVTVWSFNKGKSVFTRHNISSWSKICRIFFLQKNGPKTQVQDKAFNSKINETYLNKNNKTSSLCTIQLCFF